MKHNLKFNTDISPILMKYKLDYIIIFSLIFWINVCCRKASLDIKIYGDHFGMLASAAKLVGYNWDEVLKISAYYGPGYYVLFTPLLLLIKNPIVLYNVIIDIDYIMVAACGTLLHYIICDVLKYKNRWYSMITVIITTIMTFQMNILTFSVESPTLFLMLLLIIVIIKYINTNKLWQKILCFFVLTVIEIYSLTVHVRNIVFVLAIIATFITIMLINRPHQKQYKYIILMGLLTLTIISFIGYKSLPTLFAKIIFSSNSNASMTNQEIIIPKISSLKDTFIGILEVFGGNVVQSVKQTYGLALICYYFVFKETVFILKRSYRKGNSINSNQQEIGYEILFIFSFVCYIIGFAGLSVTWAGNMRGTGYWRYYGTYSTPMLALSLLYLVENYSKLSLRLKIVLLLCFSISFKMFLLKLVPILGEYLDFWFVYPYLQKQQNVMFAFMRTFNIVLIGVFILLFCNKFKIYAFTGLFILGYIIPQLEGGNLQSYVPRDLCDTGYKVINILSDKAYINKEHDLFFIGTDNGYRYYQYMMLGSGISRELPPNEENILFFSNEGNMQGDWMIIPLDNNEYAYTNNIEIHDQIENALTVIEEQ